MNDSTLKFVNKFCHSRFIKYSSIRHHFLLHCDLKKILEHAKLKENWGLELKLLETIDKPSIFVPIMIKLKKMGFGPVMERNATMHGMEP